jgi:hypothetical protein
MAFNTSPQQEAETTAGPFLRGLTQRVRVTEFAISLFHLCAYAAMLAQA